MKEPAPEPAKALDPTTAPDSTSLALETRGLRKTFGEFVAVDDIDLRVPRGSFYGFLGPNGAGKSTTIKCLTGLLEASAGEMRILGMDPRQEMLAIQRRIGVVPEDLALFDHLTAPETLQFVGRIHGLDHEVTASRSQELLKVLDLQPDELTLASDFSHGMRKKLSLAIALLPAPKLLFLDEPFEGLDALASRQLRGLLESYVGRGGTIFLTSHILEIVERLCDHIGVIARGRLVAQGTLEELRQAGAHGRDLEQLFLDLIGAEEAAAPQLEWLEG